MGEVVVEISEACQIHTPDLQHRDRSPLKAIPDLPNLSCFLSPQPVNRQFELRGTIALPSEVDTELDVPPEIIRQIVVELEDESWRRHEEPDWATWLNVRNVNRDFKAVVEEVFRDKYISSTPITAFTDVVSSRRIKVPFEDG